VDLPGAAVPTRPPLDSARDPLSEVEGLRIGVFAPYDLARAGGVASHIRAQAAALRARGHTTLIFGPASGSIDDGEPIGGATLVTFGGTESGLGLDPRCARRVARLFAANHFDIVHVHEPLVPLLPWFVLRYARAPVVGTFHVHRERGHSLYPIARPALRRLMRHVACRIAVSEPARRMVAAHFPGQYHVIPNGIDVHRFRHPQPRPRVMLDRGPYVLVVGRLEKRKGVDCLIDAMRLVQRTTPARLVIVGDGPERRALAAHARAVKVDAVFVGQIDDAALPAYFQASDLVCAPSLGGESFGIVLLEAMACARSVVASRIEGYEAAVGGSGCARLVEAGNSEAFGSAIESLLVDSDVRRALGARAVAYAEQYDWAAIAARLEQVYFNLVAPLRRPNLAPAR
jgi:phosphatidylinositol alpha-mannosyltransferase